MNEQLKLKISINRARYNIMFLVLLSVINVYTLLSDGTAYIPFLNSSIALYAIALGKDAGVLALGILLAAIVLIALLACYFLSKKSAFFLYIAFSLIAADTLCLIIISVATKAISIFSIFDIILHALTLVYIALGIKAYKTFEGFGKIINPQPKNNSFPVSDDEEEEIEIIEYVDDGTEPLVSGEINDLKVFAVIREAKAELVINGYTCDALDTTYKSEFELSAIVNEVEFIFQYRRSYDGTVMYLYADDTLLDSLTYED